MKGARVEPSPTIIIVPKRRRANNIGINQYFFLSLKNSHNSIIKDINNVVYYHVLKNVSSAKIIFNFLLRD